ATARCTKPTTRLPRGRISTRFARNRQGFVGTDTIEAGVDRCTDRRPGVELEVLQHNTRAISLYRRLGFSLVRVMPQRVFRDGQYLDSLLMELDKENYQRLCLDRNSVLYQSGLS